MQDRVSVATDNIFKFYATFSLVLLIFALASTLYANKSTNELLMSIHVELETLKQEKAPSVQQAARKEVLERQFEITKADKEFYKWSLAFIGAAAVLGMLYGFGRWHTRIQPLIDEAARVQLEISKLQLEKLRKEVHKPIA